MSFSNNGVDTFDPGKGYIGIRLQQGVPLLDRDWNELEDIRRHFERELRRRHIGEGVPGFNGFRISPADADDDVVIEPGGLTADGYDLVNPEAVFLSEQGDRTPLPAGDVALYLEAWVERITSAEDPALGNPQDVNMETCVRDRLRWAVRCAVRPEVPPPGSYLLAEIERPPEARRVTAEMIRDRRRTRLNLAEAVDRLAGAEARLGALEETARRIQSDLDTVKQDLSRLLWDVNIGYENLMLYFGWEQDFVVTVTDRFGAPVPNAELLCTADWGALSPAVSVTDAAGRARLSFTGVAAPAVPPPADLGKLHRIGQKVAAHALQEQAPGLAAVEYANVRFDPDELEIISRYSPPGVFDDISAALPLAPIVAVPDTRVATVTVTARPAGSTTVRGTGCFQFQVGFWVVDWARSKIIEAVAAVQVGSRIGDLLRQGITEDRFDSGKVTERLPFTLQGIGDDVQLALKRSLFTDPDVGDDQLHRGGKLGQVIAQEATAAIGARANRAVVTLLQQFADSPEVPVEEADARAARTEIVQRASQITAGFAQSQRQLFTATRLGG
ncbi:Ig-like domain-containing protein [Planobispora longispora]|uniref:Uncharacterized protein n=1 Tax=Planobispora longispora TaxID=28887 RepID=A0A8J3W7W0_9ACTN|nr:Ig-like domain-containing protein [Planobispora longispora]GIH79202.1 hypothetical protein Plo01_56310 [Planobispora longispora]